MARGRPGGDGAPFNLGEMTVTRCTVRLEDGTVGHAYVAGRDMRQAELAAVLDAVLQGPARRGAMMARGGGAAGRGAGGARATKMRRRPRQRGYSSSPWRRCDDDHADRRFRRAGAGCPALLPRGARGDGAAGPDISSARPGGGAGALGAAAAAVLLTLADADTPVWLDAGATAETWLRFHAGCPIAAAPGKAGLRAGLRHAARAAGLAQGTEEEPHRSATLVVQVAALEEGAGWRLTGPGIEHAHRLLVAGLPDRFAAEWAAQRARFPVASMSCSAPATAWPPCPAPPQWRSADGLRCRQRRRARHRGGACLAGRGTPRRSVAAGTVGRADRSATWPRGRSGHGGGRLLRPRPRGAGHQAGARRPDRGRLPAARLPHHPAPFRRQRAAGHRAMRIRRRISATYKDLPGGQVLGPTFDYTHRLLDFALAAAASRRCPRRRPGRGRDHAARNRYIGAGRADEGGGTLRSRSARPDARAAGLPGRPRRCGCRRSRAATRVSCSPSAIPPSAATAMPIPSSARSAWARWRWRSPRPNSASPSRSATSP